MGSTSSWRDAPISLHARRYSFEPSWDRDGYSTPNRMTFSTASTSWRRKRITQSAKSRYVQWPGEAKNGSWARLELYFTGIHWRFDVWTLTVSNNWGKTQLLTHSIVAMSIRPCTFLIPQLESTRSPAHVELLFVAPEHIRPSLHRGLRQHVVEIHHLWGTRLR